VLYLGSLLVENQHLFKFMYCIVLIPYHQIKKIVPVANSKCLMKKIKTNARMYGSSNAFCHVQPSEIKKYLMGHFLGLHLF